MQLLRRGFFALVLTFAALPLAAAKPEPLQVSWTPHNIATGSPCLFRAEISSPISSLRGTWLGHEIVFFPAADPRAWYGLAGVDVEAKPGSYTLALEATLEN